MNNHLSIDLDWIKTKQQLDFINELIFETLKIDQVNFCRQHHALFDFYKDMKLASLYNIDHHHDVIYEKEWKGVNEGNWIFPLLNSGAVKEYHWIKNLDSTIQNFTPENLTKIDMVYRLYDEYDWIKNINFDSLSICFSPEFCAVNLQSLWETYKYFFKSKKCTVRIFKTNIELFGISRNM